MDVHNTSYHYAELFLRNKLLATARNKVGTPSRGCGWSANSLHAEMAVVKKLGDMNKLDGCILVVRRLNRHNEVLNSKPCKTCEKFLLKCMAKHKLLKVMHS